MRGSCLSTSFLLDTHALLWFDLAPARVSDAALSVMRDRRNRIMVSAVTAFEIVIKFQVGKLAQAKPLLEDYDATLLRYGFEELPLNSAHALRVLQVGSEHPDPFDRALAAQAMTLGIPLVTRDAAFDRYANLETLW